MKRTEALSEIKHAGFENDLEKASRIQISKGIGSAAAKQAFMAGKRLKDIGALCNCTACAVKKGAKK